MPHDPVQAAIALARLQDTETRAIAIQEERRIAILEAVRAGNPLREVADIAHCSHETIRRIVAKAGEVTFEFGGREFVLPGQTVDFVLYRLAGFGRGAFAPNPVVHGGDGAWLATADYLAGKVEAARTDESGEPVPLLGGTGLALHRSLLQSEITRPSVLADLVEALADRYAA